jgi:hypothetical protein
MNKLSFFLTVVISFLTLAVFGQSKSEIVRIEFNSGTRGHTEQIILTKDSIISVEENFQKDKASPGVARKASAKEWSRVLDCLSGVRLTEIETLESPTMKRAYDGASHSSFIITTSDGSTFTHGFDDENPHQKLKPLMMEIHKYRKGT